MGLSMGLLLLHMIVLFPMPADVDMNDAQARHTFIENLPVLALRLVQVAYPDCVFRGWSGRQWPGDIKTHALSPAGRRVLGDGRDLGHGYDPWTGSAEGRASAAHGRLLTRGTHRGAKAPTSSLPGT